MFERKILRDADLTDEEIHQMLRMKCLEWPDRYNDETYDQHWSEFPGKRDFCAGRIFVLVYDGQKLVAQSESFPRTIKTEKGSVDILALAGVLSRPDYRGQGLGRQVIKPVFDRIDSGEFPFCFFQTPVPEFYAYLGCAHVEDTFFNGHLTNCREGTLFWEEHVMVYPSNRAWFRGPIDLNGPAY